ncbi:hypothetical protein HZA97_00515 [Candidatus Woesearchaeota archaeon]|nr:hypothetical protein [Candidatus Woesearchaeota archaeon]
MYSHKAIKIARPFLDSEEKKVLKAIKFFPQKYKTLICVGCGPAAYFNLALNKKLKYVGIDPWIDLFKHRISALHINKKLGAVFFKRKIEKLNVVLHKFRGPKIFIFTFNIANYIPDLAVKLSKIVDKNDLIIISTWSKTKSAINLRKKYFTYLNRLINVNQPFDCSLKLNLNKMTKELKFQFEKKIIKGKYNTCLFMKVLKNE